ncbi:MAG: HAMP domain-containing sensor histidine kinase [Pseudomonadota bacterium]
MKAFAALAAQTITKRRLTRLGNLPLEERLQLAEKQSQYANKERASFLAMVSHELRTPLHQITGFVDLLKSEDISTLDGAQRKEYFQYICDGTEQMHELTESALTFAAADFGRLPLKPQKFSLQDAATRGLRLIAPETDLSGLTDLHMEGDPTHFAQIFSSIASTYKNNGADSVAIGCNPTMDKGISLIF